eukprot:CAMPEP_0204476630 /NCGR_PEP_ID=MMETSP0471-20130131/29361_1 /ASSEMBLY_ACC=CAM_ASM_000602 /TAXON_ID=2969 /ORGANISM="Oxyrrhis marina" /LENGTH=68 /DNA_ID=CAMNT_0051479243 /DNA_START=177 /DNA_END=380 /DNA_ORIENTATION=-
MGHSPTMSSPSCALRIRLSVSVAVRAAYGRSGWEESVRAPTSALQGVFRPCVFVNVVSHCGAEFLELG